MRSAVRVPRFLSCSFARRRATRLTRPRPAGSSTAHRPPPGPAGPLGPAGPARPRGPAAMAGASWSRRTSRPRRTSGSWRWLAPPASLQADLVPRHPLRLRQVERPGRARPRRSRRSSTSRRRTRLPDRPRRLRGSAGRRPLQPEAERPARQGGTPTLWRQRPVGDRDPHRCVRRAEPQLRRVDGGLLPEEPPGGSVRPAGRLAGTTGDQDDDGTKCLRAWLPPRSSSWSRAAARRRSGRRSALSAIHGWLHR